MNDSNFPVHDDDGNRDFRDLELVGLRGKPLNPVSATKTQNDDDSPKPITKGLTWYEFLFYVALLVGFWFLGQITVGIPDELGADILVLAFALFRQRMLSNRN